MTNQQIVDSLLAEVTEAKTVGASLRTFIEGVPALIANATFNSGEPLTDTQKETIQTAIADLHSNDEASTAALLANTPATLGGSIQTPNTSTGATLGNASAGATLGSPAGVPFSR